MVEVVGMRLESGGGGGNCELQERVFVCSAG